MRRTMAVTAKRRLTSQMLSGKFMVSGYSSSSMRYSTWTVSPSSLACWVSMTVGLPEALAMAHAMALVSGEPRAAMMLVGCASSFVVFLYAVDVILTLILSCATAIWVVMLSRGVEVVLVPVCISTFEAISRFSMRSRGRFSCR